MIDGFWANGMGTEVAVRNGAAVGESEQVLTLVRSGLDKLLGGPMEQPLMARHEVSRPEVEYAIRTHGL